MIGGTLEIEVNKTNVYILLGFMKSLLVCYYLCCMYVAVSSAFRHSCDHFSLQFHLSNAIFMYCSNAG